MGIVQRLDRPVSGIILFGKTSKGAARISEQIRNHTLKKTYHALVCGAPPKQADTLVHYLTKDAKRNVVTAYEQEVEGSLRAELDYEVVEKIGNKSLVKINLKTGRPHQIRVQMASMGCPISGDVSMAHQRQLPQHRLICLNRTYSRCAPLMLNLKKRWVMKW